METIQYVAKYTIEIGWPTFLLLGLNIVLTNLLLYFLNPSSKYVYIAISISKLKVAEMIIVLAIFAALVRLLIFILMH